MKILVAGGTGFVGSALTRNLIENGHDISLLIRSGSESRIKRIGGVSVVRADFHEPVIALDFVHDAIINCVGIIREYPSKGITFERVHFELVKYLVDLARANGIGRFVQISALGVGPDRETGYFKSKYRAEEHLANSGLDFTIFRPSVIFGPDDSFINLLARMIRRFPVMPVIGDGEYRLQPVYIDDLCNAINESLKDDFAFGKTFEAGGPEVLSFNRILETLEIVLGKRVLKIHQPVWTMTVLARLFDRFSWFPITRAQLKMMSEENISNDSSLFDRYKITRGRLEDALRDYL